MSTRLLLKNALVGWRNLRNLLKMSGIQKNNQKQSKQQQQNNKSKIPKPSRTNPPYGKKIPNRPKPQNLLSSGQPKTVLKLNANNLTKTPTLQRAPMLQREQNQPHRAWEEHHMKHEHSGRHHEKSVLEKLYETAKHATKAFAKITLRDELDVWGGVQAGIQLGRNIHNTWNTHVLKVSHQLEKLGDVVVNGDGTFQVGFSRFVNPGNKNLTKILAEQAKLYERYRFKKFQIHFRSETSDAKASGGGLGRVMIGMRYDADSEDFTSSDEIENTPTTAWGSPQHDIVFDALEASKLSALNLANSTDFYVNYSADLPFPVGQNDGKWYNLGKLNICTDGVVLDATASKKLGEVFVEYDVEFIGRKNYPATGEGRDGQIPAYSNFADVPTYGGVQRTCVDGAGVDNINIFGTPGAFTSEGRVGVETLRGSDYIFDLANVNHHEVGGTSYGYIIFRRIGVPPSGSLNREIYDGIFTRPRNGGDLINSTTPSLIKVDMCWYLPPAAVGFAYNPEWWNPNIHGQNVNMWDGNPGRDVTWYYKKYTNRVPGTSYGINTPLCVGLTFWCTLPPITSVTQYLQNFCYLRIPRLVDASGNPLFHDSPSATDGTKFCVEAQVVPTLEYSHMFVSAGSDEDRILALENKLSALLNEESDSELVSEVEEKEQEKYLDPKLRVRDVPVDLTKSEASLLNRLIGKVGA